MSSDDFKLAKKRADRAKKLFDKGKMEEIIAACAKQTRYDINAGKADFIAVCRDAIKTSDDGTTEGDLNDFFEEMWLASRAARFGIQENKPCW